jgi:transcriptional regulator with XRE-family HTH domain
MNPPLSELNRNIRAEIARAGLTQAVLATQLDMSQPTLSRRLAGEADWSVRELVRLAEILGVPLSTFLPTEKASA